MMQKNLQTKRSNKCKRDHIHPHNKTIEHAWCKKCKAFVQTVGDNICICCSYKISFKDKESTVQEQRVLNQFVTAYEPLLNWYVENSYRFKKDAPIILQLKVGYWLYQIDLKWIVKYCEVANLDAYNEYSKMKRVPLRLKDYDKMLATIKLIKPFLRKVDFEITWGRSKVRQTK